MFVELSVSIAREQRITISLAALHSEVQNSWMQFPRRKIAIEWKFASVEDACNKEFLLKMSVSNKIQLTGLH